MIGATERYRWYMRYLRKLAEKIDIGRVIAPSFIKLVEASLKLDNTVDFGWKTTAEIWDVADNILEKGSKEFSNSLKFSCYLVMDPSCMFVNVGLRYWGCAIQDGAHVSGAFYPTSPSYKSINISIGDTFFPLGSASVPLFINGFYNKLGHCPERFECRCKEAAYNK